MRLLWHIGHLITDISPKLKYEAHQKHEGHNRKSICLSIPFGILPIVLLPSLSANKVFFIKMICSLSINIWRFISVKYYRWHKTLLTLSYFVNHGFNTSLFIELMLHPCRPTRLVLVLLQFSDVESPAVYWLCLTFQTKYYLKIWIPKKPMNLRHILGVIIG